MHPSAPYFVTAQLLSLKEKQLLVVKQFVTKSPRIKQMPETQFRASLIAYNFWALKIPTRTTRITGS